MPKLTPKQKKFVQEYCGSADLNATAAARAAGFACASKAGSTLLKTPHVRTAIRRRLNKSDLVSHADQERVIQELIAIGFVDPSDMFDSEGKLLPLKRMPEGVRRAIASIDVETKIHADGETETVISKIRMHPKLQALELIAKRLEMLKEKVEISISQETISNLLGAVEGQRSKVVDSSFIEAKVPGANSPPVHTLPFTG